jgi:putative transposase
LVIILGERNLVQVVREYFNHYNRARPHRSLNLRPPEPQSIRDGGLIVCSQRLHALISEYSRAS